VRLVTWNVRFGGRHDLKGEIARALTALQADVAIVTEAKLANARGDLQRELAELGWEHQLLSPLTDQRQLGVLAVSRTPFEIVEDLPGPAFMPYRHVALRAEGCDFDVMGLYIPPVNARNDNKRLFWQWMTANAEQWLERERPLAIIGDLNTGVAGVDEQAPHQLQFTDQFEQMLLAGFVDAFRLLHPAERTWSWWWSSGLGLRLDHCLVTPDLAPRVAFAHYPVRVGPHRLVKTPDQGRWGDPGLSDHAAMLVDFDRSPL
jgi:exodeoxyribonuclease-3